MRGPRLALLAVLAAVCEVGCGGVVGGIERQETGSQCGDTLSLDFSSGWPEVQCSSSCSDVHTWAVGPVFRREPRLEQYGLMVRQEYGEDGSVMCSLIDDISDSGALQSSLQAEACSSVTPLTTTTTGTGGPSGVTDVTTTTGTGGPSGVTDTTTTTTGTGGPSGVTDVTTTTTGTGGPSGVTDTTTTTGTGGPSGVTDVTTTIGTGGPSGVTDTTTTTGTGGPSGVTDITTTTGTGGPSGVTDTTTTTGTGGPSGVTDVTTTTTTGTGGPSGVTDVTTTTTIGTGGPSGVTETEETTTPTTTVTVPDCADNMDTTESVSDEEQAFHTTKQPSTVTTIATTTPPVTTTPTTPPTTTTTPRPTRVWYECPSGFVLYDNSCYHVSEREGSWEDGRNYCSSRGSKYVSITSNNEFDFVKGLVSKDTWIGLNDKKNEGTYVWDSDGSVARFLKFASGEPNDQDWHNMYVEDCVEMRENKDFLWNDESCDSSRRFACEVSATMHQG